MNIMKRPRMYGYKSKVPEKRQKMIRVILRFIIQTNNTFESERGHS